MSSVIAPAAPSVRAPLLAPRSRTASMPSSTCPPPDWRRLPSVGGFVAASPSSSCSSLRRTDARPLATHVCRAVPEEEAASTSPAASTSVSTSSSEADVEVRTDVDPTDVRLEALLPETIDEGDAAPDGSLLASALAVGLLVCPFFFWGTSMVAMKDLLPHSSPLFVASVRLIPAGFLLIAWAASQGIPQPKGFNAWAWIIAFAAVDGTGFQGFLAEGLQRTSAGLGSVIIDSQPITVAILCALLFGEALSGTAITGLGLGVAGLSLLEVPPEMFNALLSGGAAEVSSTSAAVADISSAAVAAAAPAAESGSIWESGELLMLCAAQSMAVGTVMVRGVTKYSHPIMATGWHMVLGGLPLVAYSLATEASDLAPRVAALSGADLASLAYVAVFGGAVGYGAFFYSASRGNLTALSSLTFLTPVFAATAGYLVLGETLTAQQLTGAVVTLAAVFLINAKPDDGTDADAAPVRD